MSIIKNLTFAADSVNLDGITICSVNQYNGRHQTAYSRSSTRHFVMSCGGGPHAFNAAVWAGVRCSSEGWHLLIMLRSGWRARNAAAEFSSASQASALHRAADSSGIHLTAAGSAATIHWRVKAASSVLVLNFPSPVTPKLLQAHRNLQAIHLVRSLGRKATKTPHVGTGSNATLEGAKLCASFHFNHTLRNWHSKSFTHSEEARAPIS